MFVILLVLVFVVGFFLGKHLVPILFVVALFLVPSMIGYHFAGIAGAIGLVILTIVAIVIWIKKDISSWDP